MKPGICMTYTFVSAWELISHYTPYIEGIAHIWLAVTTPLKVERKKTHNKAEKTHCPPLTGIPTTRGSQTERGKRAVCLCFTSWNNVASSHWKKGGNTSPAPFCPLAQKAELSSWKAASCGNCSSCPLPTRVSTPSTMTPYSYHPHMLCVDGGVCGLQKLP